MTAVEITLIIVGIVFLLVSFLVQEKLSPKDIESITNLSENELKIIVEKQLKNANDQVEDAITDVVEDKTETTKRALEKETNEKIMAIDEYSNTVLESMNKTHNEILFLYSMLNDKHNELTGLCSQLQRYAEHTSQIVSAAPETTDSGSVTKEVPVVEDSEYIDTLSVHQDIEEKSVKENLDETNHNFRILQLHKDGYSDVQIAKELNLGLGEVRLVIGLFKGEAVNEI